MKFELMITKELIKKLLDESIAADDHVKMSTYGSLYSEIERSESRDEYFEQRSGADEVLHWEIEGLCDSIEFKIEMGYVQAAIEQSKQLDILIALKN